MFEPIEFENAMKELDTPNTEGYEFFTESHGVKIYRLYNEVSDNTGCCNSSVLKDVNSDFLLGAGDEVKFDAISIKDIVGVGVITDKGVRLLIKQCEND